MPALLLDTHVLLWANSEPERLAIGVRSSLTDPANDLLVSSITAAEIEIKLALGKLEMPHTCDVLVAEIGASWLDLTGRHATALRALPALHGDPFDRLLLAQALVEEIPLVTADRQILAYPVTTVPAC